MMVHHVMMSIEHIERIEVKAKKRNKLNPVGNSMTMLSLDLAEKCIESRKFSKDLFLTYYLNVSNNWSHQKILQ